MFQEADGEPIARAVGQQLNHARRAWRQVDLPKWLKILIVIGGIFMLLATSHALIPLGIVVTTLYCSYWIVRAIYLSFFGRPRLERRSFVGGNAARSPAEREMAVPAFIVKPARQRTTELIGSLLVSAAVTAAMTVVMSLIAGYNGPTLQVEQAAWLFAMSLAGAWTVLAASKFWEGSRGEPMLRRFILMTIGLGLGLAAFHLADVFVVELPIDRELAIRVPLLPNFYQNGRPTAMAFMAVFAALFAILKWWVDADPMRSSRLSIWSLVVTVVFSSIVGLALGFPRSTIVAVAACMSVAIQLSSPWVPTHARLRPQRKTII